MDGIEIENSKRFSSLKEQCNDGDGDGNGVRNNRNYVRTPKRRHDPKFLCD
jgi:hypothetical protein